MKHEYRRIPIDQIDVPEDRVRAIRIDRVQVLSSDIKANGLLQPIGVVEEETGRFGLVFGAHRLFAVKMTGGHEIDARVQPHNWIKSQQRRIDEIMENLNREGLTALERADSLAVLKVAHEELYPESRKGGDRGNQHRGGKKRQTEIFSFSQDAAERLDLSRRAVEIAVAIALGLDAGVKSRLRGTWLADHQAGLRQLAGQPAETQHKICDLLFATPPEAVSVAEAMALAEGRRLPTPAEKLVTSVMNNFSRLTERDRRAVFDAHQDDIRAYAQEKGWL